MAAAHLRLAILTFAGLAAGIVTALAILPQARERLLPAPKATVEASGRALIGGPFTLTDHTGKRVSDADFRGRTMLVLFGCTSCGDTGSAALQVLAAALDRLGANAERFVPILITVDPERDTPARLKAYVERFHPRLLGLTGAPAEIAEVLKAYRVQGVRKRGDPNAPAGYTIDRPTLIYVMDGDGHYRTLLNFAAGVDAVAASLARLL